MKKALMIFVAVLLSAACVRADESEYQSNVGKTPPMGWNSWNRFHKNISAETIRDIADGASKHGLAELGYRYLVIDDAWQASELGPNGELVPDPEKFPNGIAALAEYVEERSFELGIYACPNKLTCAGYPGSLGHENVHAKQFVDWGCTFLKYDFCPTRNGELGLGYEEVVKRYKAMSDALHDQDPNFVFAICEKGHAGRITRRTRENAGITTPVTLEERLNAFSWCPKVRGAMWRTTLDISADWDKIMSIFDEQAGLGKLAGPNAFNDPDMLEVGNGDLTEAENRAHFSLWCMLSAPLILGNDLRDIPEDVLAVIANKELIAVDQDLMCRQAEKILDNGDIEYFVKPLANGDFAVCVLNRAEQKQDAVIDWSELELPHDAYAMRDLWTHKDLGLVTGRFTRTIEPHDVFVVRISNAE